MFVHTIRKNSYKIKPFIGLQKLHKTVFREIDQPIMSKQFFRVLKMAVFILKREGQLEFDLSRADINHKKPPKQNLNPTVLCVCLSGYAYICTL